MGKIIFKFKSLGGGVAGDVVFNDAELVGNEDFGGGDFRGFDESVNEIVFIFFFEFIVVLGFEIFLNVGF